MPRHLCPSWRPLRTIGFQSVNAAICLHPLLSMSQAPLLHYCQMRAATRLLGDADASHWHTPGGLGKLPDLWDFHRTKSDGFFSLTGYVHSSVLIAWAFYSSCSLYATKIQAFQLSSAQAIAFFSYSCITFVLSPEFLGRVLNPVSQESSPESINSTSFSL